MDNSYCTLEPARGYAIMLNKEGGNEAINQGNNNLIAQSSCKQKLRKT